MQACHLQETMKPPVTFPAFRRAELGDNGLRKKAVLLLRELVSTHACTRSMTPAQRMQASIAPKCRQPSGFKLCDELLTCTTTYCHPIKLPSPPPSRPNVLPGHLRKVCQDC